MKLTLIGDTHGKYVQYKRLIKAHPNTIQVGDMGVGFLRWPHGEPSQNPPHALMVAGKHRFIRGNHDNPQACTQQSQWIPDGHVEDSIMFIGGAVSIDRAYRTEGFSWWPDEELSQTALTAMIDKYLSVKPRVMVTHECPETMAEVVVRAKLTIEGGWSGGKLLPEFASRTRVAFQHMWSAHSPELWVFGHWHTSFDHVLKGTRFVCLNELELKEFEI